MLKSIRKQSYLLKRVLLTLPILFLLPLLTFWLMHLVPGNYFDQLRLNPQISSETIKEYEDMYHLNEPLGVQYVSWLKQITKLNFMRSAKLVPEQIDVTGAKPNQSCCD